MRSSIIFKSETDTKTTKSLRMPTRNHSQYVNKSSLNVFEKKKDLHSLKETPQIFINYRGKDSNFTVAKSYFNQAEATLTTWSRWTSPVIWHTDIRNSLISIQFSCSVVSDSLWPHELQHARPPYPSPTPRVYSLI